jgi:hypothetical protein
MHDGFDAGPSPGIDHVGVTLVFGPARPATIGSPARCLALGDNARNQATAVPDGRPAQTDE